MNDSALFQTLPLNDNYIKDVNSKNYIPVKASDYISETGSNIESSLNIKIGDKINNVPIKLWKIENNEKSKKKEIQYKDLILISSSKEKNIVIMKDNQNFLYELPRQKILDHYKKYHRFEKSVNYNSGIER